MWKAQSILLATARKGSFGSSERLPATFRWNFGRRSASTDANEKLRLTTLRLYRILQRSCREFRGDAILLQPPLRASDWGHFRFHEGNNKLQSDSKNNILRWFLVSNDEDPDAGFSSMVDWYNELTSELQTGNLPKGNDASCWTTKSDVVETLRFAFRSLSPNPPIELQGWALKAIQSLQEQNSLWNNTSVSTTDGVVKVTATSHCLGKVSPVTAIASLQDPPKYRFAYRIRVENISESQTVQLLGRYWHIMEESGEPIEVDAPYTGAVGQLPVLPPGSVFEYVSGTDLTTPTGSMRGHFYMAQVPETTLSAQSGDTVAAISNESSKNTRLFQAPVLPFPLESFVA